MKIYVGCSLIHASDEFRQSVEDVKQKLRSIGHEVFDFVAMTQGEPKDVYQWDIHNCVKNCDLFVAICDLPSIGLGYELGFAVEKLGKLVLAVAHKEAKVSRLVLGIDHPNFQFKTYDDMSEIPNFVTELASKI